MKTKDIAAKYGIDQNSFEKFLAVNNLKFSEGLMNISVDDGAVESYVSLYRNKMERNRLAAEQKAQAEAEKKRAMAQMLISSGFSFDGYKIVKYSGYISGDDATQIPRTFVFAENKNSEQLTGALVKIRRQALKELKEAAYNLGCNAVVGVDFDYITLEPERADLAGRTVYEPYVICVTANGNAVIIEKETE